VRYKIDLSSRTWKLFEFEALVFSLSHLEEAQAMRARRFVLGAIGREAQERPL